jgi:hypothetical protein
VSSGYFVDLATSTRKWRSQEFRSGWAQTEKFEDLPFNLLLFKRFSKFFGEACAHPARILASPLVLEYSYLYGY